MTPESSVQIINQHLPRGCCKCNDHHGPTYGMKLAKIFANLTVAEEYPAKRSPLRPAERWWNSLSQNLPDLRENHRLLRHDSQRLLAGLALDSEKSPNPISRRSGLEKVTWRSFSIEQISERQLFKIWKMSLHVREFRAPFKLWASNWKLSKLWKTMWSFDGRKTGDSLKNTQT